jgi:hypothetical protein
MKNRLHTTTRELPNTPTTMEIVKDSIWGKDILKRIEDLENEIKELKGEK